MTHYTLEFAGGLGDVFYQLYDRGAYNVLRDLEPGDTARVFLISHNPYAHELFQWHPKREQFSVECIDYWAMRRTTGLREQYGLPAAGSNRKLPLKDSTVEYHTVVEESAMLTTLQAKKYVVVAPTAGAAGRCISESLLLRHILPALIGKQVVLVGRSYGESDRPELRALDYPGMWNWTDKLSVPATARLVQQAAGLVTSHSSLNLLGWWENIPQLLLYPQSVLDRHRQNGQYDLWMFGARRANTVHGLFDQCDEAMVSRFLERLSGAR